MCGKSQKSTSTTTSTPNIPPEIMAAYNDVVGKAQGVANTPYTPYTGQLAANASPLQQQGFNYIGSNTNVADPYYNYASANAGNSVNQLGQTFGNLDPYYGAATSLVGQGAQGMTNGLNAANPMYGAAAGYGLQAGQNVSDRVAGLNNQALNGIAGAGLGSTLAGTGDIGNNITGIGGDRLNSQYGQGMNYLGQSARDIGSQLPQYNTDTLASYQDPYTQQVIQQFLQKSNQQDQLQQNQLTGNAIANNAFGGDRAALASAALAGQQADSRNSTVANMLSQGFQNAQNQLNNQQQLGLAASQASQGLQQNAANTALGLYGQGQNLQNSAAQGTANNRLNAGNSLMSFYGGQQGNQLAGLNADAGNAANAAGIFGNLGQQQSQNAFNYNSSLLNSANSLSGLAGQQSQNALNLNNANQDFSKFLAGLGTQQQTNALNTGQQLLQAGDQQRGISQDALTAAYNQWQQQQNWPYQNIQFLGNIVNGIGGNLTGQTQTTESVQPGGGLLSGILASGGRVKGYAGGGGVTSFMPSGDDWKKNPSPLEQAAGEVGKDTNNPWLNTLGWAGMGLLSGRGLAGGAQMYLMNKLNKNDFDFGKTFDQIFKNGGSVHKYAAGGVTDLDEDGVPDTEDESVFGAPVPQAPEAGLAAPQMPQPQRLPDSPPPEGGMAPPSMPQPQGLAAQAPKPQHDDEQDWTESDWAPILLGGLGLLSGRGISQGLLQWLAMRDKSRSNKALQDYRQSQLGMTAEKNAADAARADAKAKVEARHIDTNGPNIHVIDLSDFDETGKPKTYDLGIPTVTSDQLADNERDAASDAETVRHNKAGESYNWAQLEEVKRNNNLQNERSGRNDDLNRKKLEMDIAKTESELQQNQSSKEGTAATFDTAIGTLDRLKTHAGKSEAVGAGWEKTARGIATALPGIDATGVTPGTDRANFLADLDAFKAQVFLPMVQQLRGLGALSNAEGQKLSDAVGALTPEMSEAEFDKSIDRIKTDLEAARKRVLGTKKAAPAPTTNVPEIVDFNKLPKANN